MKDFIISINPSSAKVGMDSTITLTIEAQNKTAQCTKIYIEIYVDDGTDALFLYNKGIHPITTTISDKKWNTSVNTHKESMTHRSYTFINMNSSKTLEESLKITLSGRVNDQLGISDVYVNLNESPDKDIHFSIQKVSNEFYLRNFITRTDKAANIPITEFKSSQKIYFSWESNGTNYKLYDGRNEAPIYDGHETNCTFDRGISHDTTFVLIAENTDGINKYELIDHITAVVSNPDIVAKSMRVEKNSTLNQTKILGNVELNATTTQSIFVPKGGKMYVEGKVIFKDNLIYYYPMNCGKGIYRSIFACDCFLFVNFYNLSNEPINGSIFISRYEKRYYSSKEKHDSPHDFLFARKDAQITVIVNGNGYFSLETIAFGFNDGISSEIF